MSTSIIIPIGPRTESPLPMLQSLVTSTPDDVYDVIFVVKGEVPNMLDLLQQLEGDLTVIDAPIDANLALCANLAAPRVTGDTLVISTSSSRFQPGWLEKMRYALQSAAFANAPECGTDVVGFRMDMFRTYGGLDATASDSTVLDAYARRLETAFRRQKAAQSFNIPGDLLGWRVGESLAEVLAAGLDDAAVGELPEEPAERLRERLWQEEERRLLLAVRAGRDVCWTDEGVTEPLVTVRIATHNRAEELMEIALPSALNQTYERLDILVIGDHTDEATIKAMDSVRDPRVRFFNLPSKSMYPTDKWGHWLVHGSPAMNLGIELAEGSWINPMDDDDEMTPDHVEVLLREARTRRLEFVWSQTLMETLEGWQVLGSEPLGPGATTAGAIMWSSGLRFMKMSTTCWKINEPHDGNMWRRMHEIGVRMGFVPKITYRYYLNGNMKTTEGSR